MGGVQGPEGCMILGFVAVNRVPGNLFFTAHSKSHSFNVSKMNISHHIQSFSFGKMLNKKEQRVLPEEVSSGVIMTTPHLTSPHTSSSSTDHLACP